MKTTPTAVSAARAAAIKTQGKFNNRNNNNGKKKLLQSVNRQKDKKNCVFSFTNREKQQ